MSIPSPQCNQYCKSGRESCVEAHITVSAGSRWYIGRPNPDTKMKVKRIDCRIGHHDSDPESRSRCHADGSCQHAIVFHTKDGEVLRKGSRGVVLALKELFKISWEGPMTTHFDDLEFNVMVGGRPYTEAEMDQAREMYYEMERIGRRRRIAPKKKSTAPKRAITK
jgi:hypothetical protein